MTSLANESHSRPSLLLPVLETGGWALGVAAGLAPRKVFVSAHFMSYQWRDINITTFITVRMCQKLSEYLLKPLLCLCQFSMAIAGALQDTLTEHYNDHIRELRESGDLEKVGSFTVADKITKKGSSCFMV